MCEFDPSVVSQPVLQPKIDYTIIAESLQNKGFLVLLAGLQTPNCCNLSEKLPKVAETDFDLHWVVEVTVSFSLCRPVAAAVVTTQCAV